jgi:hypothetical protein
MRVAVVSDVHDGRLCVPKRFRRSAWARPQRGLSSGETLAPDPLASDV